MVTLSGDLTGIHCVVIAGPVDQLGGTRPPLKPRFRCFGAKSLCPGDGFQEREVPKHNFGLCSVFDRCRVGELQRAQQAQ